MQEINTNTMFKTNSDKAKSVVTLGHWLFLSVLYNVLLLFKNP